MNRFGLMIAAACAALLAGGCATNSGTQKASDDEDKVYVTGSRIPVKSGSVHGNVSVNADRKSIDDMVRRPGTAGSSAN